MQEDPASDKSELNRLKEDSDRYKQNYDETYSRLKPLLDEIKSFVNPIIEQRRERKL